VMGQKVPIRGRGFGASMMGLSTRKYGRAVRESWGCGR
jgi:hypothetical protein